MIGGTSALPGVVALAIGVLIGVIGAFRLARQAKRNSAETAGDLALRLEDLQQRYDETMARLQNAAVDGTNDGDRAELETTAARALRDLEQLKGQTAAPSARPRGAVATEGGAARAPGGSVISRHPLLAGAALGGGIVGLVGMLIYWALEDARPRDQMPPPGPPSQNAGQNSGQAAGQPLDTAQNAALSQQLEALQQRIAADPNDRTARKQMTLLFLDSGMLFESFQSAEELLTLDPDDPDGLYAQGVVRFAMGQDEEAVTTLERVVELFPEHGRAWLIIGLAHVRGGQRTEAIAAWRRASETSPEASTRFAQLIELAESDAAAEEIFSALGVGVASTPAGATVAAPPTAASTPGSSAGAELFRARIELAGSTPPPPGATLFVFLRSDAPGPPTAVKRIDRPSFPIDVALGDADSMLGRPLPQSGRLAARLDADGSASTQGPDDLEAEIAIEQGQEVRLVLERAPAP